MWLSIFNRLFNAFLYLFRTIVLNTNHKFKIVEISTKVVGLATIHFVQITYFKYNL